MESFLSLWYWLIRTVSGWVSLVICAIFAYSLVASWHYRKTPPSLSVPLDYAQTGVSLETCPLCEVEQLVLLDRDDEGPGSQRPALEREIPYEYPIEQPCRARVVLVGPIDAA